MTPPARREEDVEAQEIQAAVWAIQNAPEGAHFEEVDYWLRLLAREVARLSGERERLREALRDFAALDLYAMKHLADMDARAIDYADYAVLLKAQEAARAALSAGAESEAAKEAGEYFDQLTGRDA